MFLSGKCCSNQKIKLYEPNEIINMIGVRIERNNFGLRLYKQQSTNSREDIRSQFDEIRNQFRSASIGREAMLLTH